MMFQIETCLDLVKISHKTNIDNKLEKIGQILEILEEKEKTKGWLLEKIKKQHFKHKFSHALNSFEILKSCSDNELFKILQELQEEVIIEDVKTLTRTLHCFFTDIVGSSDPTISVKTQVRKINLLNTLMKKTEIFKQADLSSLYIQTTGDGMVIGFIDSPEKPLKLAIQLHKLLYQYNKKHNEKERLHLRIGIDTGPIYFIKDVKGNDTVWGPGIIMARRVMDLCGEDQIFASRRIGDDIRRLSLEYKDIMHPIGDYVIKHGEQLLIYNIYGKSFGNKNSPKKNKILKPKIGFDDPFSNQPLFEFNNVEIRLDITNPKDMMTHHTWVWDIKSLSENPIWQIFYYIEGETKKDFGDLNISVEDENKNKLEIISADVNKPYKKTFNVKLKKPIRRNQRGRILKLEYDWEEPERSFQYELSARCKKFAYIFTAPKSFDVKIRALEVDRNRGIKKHAESPPVVKYLNDVTKITWESDKKRLINKNETFEFQW